MRFRKTGRLDTGQVSDQRGAGSGGFPIGPGMAIGGGGGIVGVILTILLVLGGFDGGGGTGSHRDGASNAKDLSGECQTGADANQHQDCRIVAVVNSVQDYWATQIDGYTDATTVFFSGQVSTGCGTATTSRPLLLPERRARVHRPRLLPGAALALRRAGRAVRQAYVIAHEYGHHVQQLLGTDAGGSAQGATSGSVRLELQADCYAGVWAANATKTKLIEGITNDDIARGLDAAAAVGDDRIQKETTGRVNPETWTHGSAAERQHWFTRGYGAGDPRHCDTFAPNAISR